jgi:hypothetical protein
MYFLKKEEFGSTKLVTHRIETGDAAPIVPYALRQEMENQVKDLLSKVIIRESDSPWSGAAILVPKKSPHGKQKWHMCIDFKSPNAVTKFQAYQLPHVEDMISCLHGSRFIGPTLFQRVFFKWKLMSHTNKKLALSVPSGHFEYNRLCFGLCHAPPTFQRLMDKVLGGLVGTEVYCYIDDLIVFSSTAKEHAVRLEHVLQRLENANLKLQPDKSFIAQPEVEYLGFIINASGVSANPAKVQAVRNDPVPKNEEVRSF